MNEQITAIKKTANTLSVTWHLGNSCNYECSYCPAYLHDGSERWSSVDNMKITLSGMYDHYVTKLGKRIILNFSGGEPTLFPHFIEMAQFAKSLGPEIVVSLISNGSRTLRYWRELRPHIHSSILSYHNEFANFDHFVEVVKILGKKLYRIHFNMQPKNWDLCVDSYMKLKNFGYPVFAKPLFIGFAQELYPYTEDQMNFIRDSTTSSINALVTRNGIEAPEAVEDIILNKENLFTGWDCMVGVEHVSVKRNGDIMMGECNVKRIGNINRPEAGFSFPTSSVVCDRKFCSCIVDIMTTKSQRGEQQNVIHI